MLLKSTKTVQQAVVGVNVEEGFVGNHPIGIVLPAHCIIYRVMVVFINTYQDPTNLARFGIGYQTLTEDPQITNQTFFSFAPIPVSAFPLFTPFDATFCSPSQPLYLPYAVNIIGVVFNQPVTDGRNLVFVEYTESDMG